MKLIRLESDSVVTKSEFTNNMAIPLEVSSNSKVALKTLSMQFDAPPIVIDSTNNTFTLRTDVASGLLFGTLERKEYASVDELCKEIERILNSLMQSFDDGGVNKSSVGLEWTASSTQDVQNNSKVTIAFNRADPTLIVPTAADLINIDTDGTVYYKVGDNTGDYNASLEVITPINEGGYAYEVKLVEHGLANVADTTWKFYLKNYNGNTLNGVLATDGFYQIYIFGQWLTTAIAVEANDVITVTKKLLTLSNDTRILYTITNGTNVKAEINGDLVSQLEQFRNTLWLEIADDLGEVGFETITYIPTTQVSSVGGQLIKKRADEVLHVVRDSNLKTTASTVTLTLSDGLARLLGYAPAILTQNAVSFAFVAQSNVTTNIFNNDIVVELIQLPLNGYDHSVKKTKNMIMVITSGSLNSSTKATGTEQYELSYTDNFPTYVSLQNNKQSTTYSQLTVRVTSENRTLVTNGKMSCLLLFKDDSDY
jgi:hypothetical protein